MKRTLMVAMSDTHAGHKLGLCLPGTTVEILDSGDVVKKELELSHTQEFMADVYAWGVGETVKLAGKDKIIVVHDGDPTHGRSSFLQLMTSRLSDQFVIAQRNFEEWLKHKNVVAVRFAVGTGMHELGEGSSSIIISNVLMGKYPKVDIGVVYHGLLNVAGVDIDYAHHGPSGGIRTWLKGNILRYYLRDIMMEHLMAGKRPPDLVLRGHYHTCIREWLEISADGKQYSSWIVILPGFTFKDDYTRRVTRSEYKQTVGMVVFEIIDGKIYDTHRFTETVDIRTKEQL